MIISLKDMRNSTGKSGTAIEVFKADYRISCHRFIHHIYGTLKSNLQHIVLFWQIAGYSRDTEWIYFFKVFL